MARKLKTYITNLGFFELALAAPSMKAALEAWGMSHNAFHRGSAKETNDQNIVAATMANPGVVLKRPVGTKGAFTEDAKLPTSLWMGAPPNVGTVAKPKQEAHAKPKANPKSAKDEKQQRAAILSFEKARQRRESEREKQEARQAGQREKEQERIGRVLAKADEALEVAEKRHKAAMADIERERDKLDRRAQIEKERWERERDRLEEARERVAK